MFFLLIWLNIGTEYNIIDCKHLLDTIEKEEEIKNDDTRKGNQSAEDVDLKLSDKDEFNFTILIREGNLITMNKDNLLVSESQLLSFPNNIMFGYSVSDRTLGSYELKDEGILLIEKLFQIPDEISISNLKIHLSISGILRIFNNSKIIFEYVFYLKDEEVVSSLIMDPNGHLSIINTNTEVLWSLKLYSRIEIEFKVSDYILSQSGTYTYNEEFDKYISEMASMYFENNKWYIKDSDDTTTPVLMSSETVVDNISFIRNLNWYKVDTPYTIKSKVVLL